jgi:hypothetical protein
VSPLPHRSGGTVARLQHDEVDAALGQVRGGGEPDRAGADDHDGQGRAGVLGRPRDGRLRDGRHRLISRR